MSRTKLKMYGVLLVVAVTGFVVDRFIIGDPAGAAAATSDPDLPENLIQGGAHPEVAPPPQDEVPFPRNLPGARDIAVSKNPFVLPPDLAARRDSRLGIDGRGASSNPVRRPGEPLRASEFVKVYHLSGVILGNMHMAVIDGRDVVEVGQTWDSAVLLRIEGDKAYFQCADGEAVLELSGNAE